MTWILATHKPYQGDSVVESATSLGFRCFLPKFAETRVRRGRRVEDILPVFGSYFFAYLTPQWGSLLSMKGVRDVVRLGEQPVPIPDRAVDELLDRVDERGLFVMPKRDKNRFRKGSRVTPSEGPLQYYVGVYEGTSAKGREAALFSMMGASRRIEFDTGVLLAA